MLRLAITSTSLNRARAILSRVSLLRMYARDFTSMRVRALGRSNRVVIIKLRTLCRLAQHQEQTTPLSMLPKSQPLAELVALAKTAAQAHGLDPALVCAVVEQESGWNTWSVRFEPGFLKRYVHPSDYPTTLEITKATSFGLMQVMGLVAIEMGWKGHYLTELCDASVGLEFGCRKLAACHKSHPEEPLLAYNGGGNISYPKQVRARMDKYK